MHGNRERIDIPPDQSFRVLRWSEHVGKVECVLAPGRVQPIFGEGAHWHYHTEMELTLFRVGEGTRFVGDHIGYFVKEDLVLLGEKLPHYWHAMGSSSGLSIQWSFPTGHAFWTLPETLALRDFFEKAGRGIRYGGRTAREAGSSMHDVSMAVGSARLGHLLRLFAMLATAPESDQSFLAGRTFSRPSKFTHQDAMKKAVGYLVVNFRNKIRLEDVLERVGMNKPTFSRQFKAHSGKSFSDFVSRLRLEAACRDLAETDRSILDIALDSGFTQVSFFNRFFRRMLKCSPSRYREKERTRSAKVMNVG
jgi:AraC-like DNA-binding protein